MYVTEENSQVNLCYIISKNNASQPTSSIEGGLGSGAGFVIYDETVADKRGDEVENSENGPEDKENM